VKQVRQKPADWKLDTTLTDLARSVDHVADAQQQTALAAMLAELKTLLPAPIT
jgi:hypothetical protein